MTQSATRADWLLAQSQQHFQKLAALAVRAEGAQRMGRIMAQQQFARSPSTVDSSVGRVIDTEGLEKEAISGLVSAVKGGLRAAKGAYQSARAEGVGAAKAVGRALKPGIGGVKSTQQQFRQQYGLLRSGGAGRVKALKGAEARMRVYAPGQYKPGTTGGSVTGSTGKAFRNTPAPTSTQPVGPPTIGGAPAGAPRAQAPTASGATRIEKPQAIPAGTGATPPPAGMPAAPSQTVHVPPIQSTQAGTVLEPGRGAGRLIAGAEPPPIVQGGAYRAAGGVPSAPVPPAAPPQTMFGEAMEGAVGGATPANIPAQGAAPMTARAQRAAARRAADQQRALRRGVPEGVDVDVAGAVPTAPAAPPAAVPAAAPAATPATTANGAVATAPSGSTAEGQNWVSGLPWGKALLGAGLVGGGVGAAGLAMGAGQALRQTGAPYTYGMGSPLPGTRAYQM